MKSEYTAKFRMVDEMSAAMVRLGDTGVNAIVDVEKSSVFPVFFGVNSGFIRYEQRKPYVFPWGINGKMWENFVDNVDNFVEKVQAGGKCTI